MKFERKMLALGRMTTVTGVVEHSSDIFRIKICYVVSVASTVATSDTISCYV
jgi:hypothetical protein